MVIMKNINGIYLIGQKGKMCLQSSMVLEEKIL